MKYSELRKRLKKRIFSKQDLRLGGGKVFDYQLSLWQKQQYIIKLKNGVYLFADEASRVSPEEVAFHVYSPSYISLEKALSIYGLIPEMVYSVTSVTPRTTRSFKNRFGNFIYKHIKPSLFFGYREIKEDQSFYLLAEPEKALLDYLYLHKIYAGEGWEELRLNQKLIKKTFRPRVFSKYLKMFDNRRIKKLCRECLGIK